MSGKLSPRPTNKRPPQYTMEDLDRLLQRMFSDPTTDHPVALISLADYIPTKESIIEQAEKNGYKVTEQEGNRLRIE